MQRACTILCLYSHCTLTLQNGSKRLCHVVIYKRAHSLHPDSRQVCAQCGGFSEVVSLKSSVKAGIGDAFPGDWDVGACLPILNRAPLDTASISRGLQAVWHAVTSRRSLCICELAWPQTRRRIRTPSLAAFASHSLMSIPTWQSTLTDGCEPMVARHPQRSVTHNRGSLTSASG